MKPTTPLPWKPWTKKIHHEIYSGDVIVAEVRQCEGPNGSTHEDARYIAHAANAYPKLVEALRTALLAWEKPNPTHTATYRRNYERLSGLLRELGEEG